MNAGRVAAIVLRYYYLLRGSLPRSMPLFLWVAIDIVLWGFITRYLNEVSRPGFDFVPVFLGAVLLWDFFSRVMMGVTMVFFEDVWSRNFLNFFATPLSIAEYLAGLVVASVATSAIGLVVMVGLAGLFGLSFFSYGIYLIPFLLNLFIFGIALGIVSSAIVLRLGPAAEWFVWPIPVVISPFAAVYYPLSTLPEWMQAVARLLPPSYVFESLRAMIAGQPPSPRDLVVATALSLAYLLAACGVFSAVYRLAVRTGLIARYSAESVS